MYSSTVISCHSTHTGCLTKRINSSVLLPKILTLRLVIASYGFCTVYNAFLIVNCILFCQASRETPSCPLLGYTYNSRHSINIESGSAEIASISFTKKQNTSHLRLSYSGNVRTKISPGSAARWFFKINGQECSTPTKIDIAMYQNVRDNTHVPGYLTGICTGTAAGKIAAGQHQITVHVGKHSDFSLAQAYSGWASTSFLEVQELCPPF